MSVLARSSACSFLSRGDGQKLKRSAPTARATLRPASVARASISTGVVTSVLGKNKLGWSDLEVSKVCLGTMTWGSQNNQQEVITKEENAHSGEACSRECKFCYLIVVLFG